MLHELREYVDHQKNSKESKTISTRDECKDFIYKYFKDLEIKDSKALENLPGDDIIKSSLDQDEHGTFRKQHDSETPSPDNHHNIIQSLNLPESLQEDSPIQTFQASAERKVNTKFIMSD